MAAPISSCCASSLRLIPIKRNLFTSVNYPSKSLILQPIKPSQIPSFRRTIITFQKIPNDTVSPPQSASSSSPSTSQDLQLIEELPPKLQEIIKRFQSVEDPKAKYNQLIYYGMKLKPLNPEFKTAENKVQGCVSQVWVRAFFDEKRNIVYEADSDASIPKGLAAILVNGLSGSPLTEILKVKPDFFVLLGLNQKMSASRSNGFLNMLNLMQKKALHLAVNSEEDSSSGEVSLSPPEADNEASAPEADSVTEEIEIVALGSRGIRIREILEKELNPVELVVEDVSYQHAGHAGVRDSGGDGETHFNLRVVSDGFQGKSLVKRHRLIYELLDNEMKSGLHALSIVAKTPAEV